MAVGGGGEVGAGGEVGCGGGGTVEGGAVGAAAGPPPGKRIIVPVISRLDGRQL